MSMFTLKKKIVAVISLAVMLAFGISWLLLYGVVRNGIVRQSTLELSQQTALLAASLKDGGMERFTANVEKWEDILRGRVTLIGSNGVVLADTERSPEAMENHLTRPEVKEALASGEGSALRYSATTNMYYLYFARKVEAEGRVAVLRAAYPLEFLSERGLRDCSSVRSIGSWSSRARLRRGRRSVFRSWRSRSCNGFPARSTGCPPDFVGRWPSFARNARIFRAS
jgi:hypothetical protein